MKWGFFCGYLDVPLCFQGFHCSPVSPNPTTELLRQSPARSSNITPDTDARPMPSMAVGGLTSHLLQPTPPWVLLSPSSQSRLWVKESHPGGGVKRHPHAEPGFCPTGLFHRLLLHTYKNIDHLLGSSFWEKQRPFLCRTTFLSAEAYTCPCVLRFLVSLFLFFIDYNWHVTLSCFWVGKVRSYHGIAKSGPKDDQAQHSNLFHDCFLLTEIIRGHCITPKNEHSIPVVVWQIWDYHCPSSDEFAISITVAED